MSDAYWRQPVKWNREAADAGGRARVFCASMGDVFEHRDDLKQVREKLWDLVAQTPSLDWLMLTKRPEHVMSAVPDWGSEWPRNLWIGTTAETQRWAERRIARLVKIPAAVRFLSCEPLLGPVDLRQWLAPTSDGFRVDWVIVGGESGHKARVMNPEWARTIRDQCAEAGVPFHFKQWGNWRPSDGHVNGFKSKLVRALRGDQITMVNVGKKAAGRELDGEEWDLLPCGN